MVAFEYWSWISRSEWINYSRYRISVDSLINAVLKDIFHTIFDLKLELLYHKGNNEHDKFLTQVIIIFMLSIRLLEWGTRF